jgi:mono/diheme cytochrome c family protein
MAMRDAIRPVLAAATALAFSGSLPCPSLAADAAHGRLLAGQWCASCHIIDNEGTGTPFGLAPDFPIVARHEGKSPDRLREWLATTHPRIADFEMTEKPVADLVAYIVSLDPGEGVTGNPAASRSGDDRPAASDNR